MRFFIFVVIFLKRSKFDCDNLSQTCAHINSKIQLSFTLANFRASHMDILTSQTGMFVYKIIL